MRKTGLTTIPSCAIIIKRAGEKTVKCQDAGIAHLVERRLAKAEVAGSSPVSRSTEYAPFAQLVEHLTLNQGVQGSSP